MVTVSQSVFCAKTRYTGFVVEPASSAQVEAQIFHFVLHCQYAITWYKVTDTLAQFMSLCPLDREAHLNHSPSPATCLVL